MQQGRHYFNMAESSQERVRRRQVPARPVLSDGVVECAKHMDAYARVCSCQLRLHVFPGYTALLYVIQGNVIKWLQYT